jgi:two-component system, cell cycle response regulator
MHAAVVDPSRVVLKLVAELLAERGERTTDFTDSAAALRAIRSDPTIDLLITSLEVQPLTGLELCWEARLSMPAQRPFYIIVMSSASDDHKLSEALDCGADDLISKPLRSLELHARLRMASRLKEAHLRLVRLAETDPLTGLLNRRAFFERLNGMLAIPELAPLLTAVLCDIDHFKKVNDTYGHDVGDIVLKRIATEVSCVAEMCGRLGGEEFAFILRGSTPVKSFHMADALRKRCEVIRFTEAGDPPFQVTCSFGLSGGQEGDTADDVLKRADIALYQAKAGGRNRVQAASRLVADGSGSTAGVRKRGAPGV